MPYINQNRRDELMEKIKPLLDELGENQEPGELNFILTTLVKKYLDPNNENSSHTPFASVSYEDLNELIGVLECTKQELYRRKVAPYEDKKIRQNGDLYYSE